MVISPLLDDKIKRAQPLKWSRPAKTNEYLTSASRQNAAPVAKKIIGPKIKNARKKSCERNKPSINQRGQMSDFYI
jgi:hypothetical protein